MERWERALHQFLTKWRTREDVIAAVVCGSYVTGHASQRSDIDVHIILDKDEDWRERGNEYIDGFLVEYFANPPKQIRRYFEEDHKDRSTMSMVQFITGRVVFDKKGIVPILKQEAAHWKGMKYPELGHSIQEIRKYGLWDAFDNLMDCHENDRNDFFMVYYQVLVHVFKEYCFLRGLEFIPYNQISSYLTQPQYLAKYLKDPFPDNVFADLFLKAMDCKSQKVMVENLEDLLDHVYQNTGGFHIDGWKMRTPVEKE